MSRSRLAHLPAPRHPFRRQRWHTVLGRSHAGIYDLDATQLPPLPSANDEARAVATTLGAAHSTILLGDAATEQELKSQPLNDYGVLHFAAHGIVSTKFPARSALLLRPSGPRMAWFKHGRFWSGVLPRSW